MPMTISGLRLHLSGRGLGGVARSVVLVGAASAVGQGALILASPVLARLYDPASFGMLSAYAAILGVLLAVASLRFDMAIPLADDDVAAVDLLVLGIVVALGSSLLLAVVLLVGGGLLASALAIQNAGPLLWMLPIGLFAAGVAQAMASWAVYRRKFPALGRMRALQGLVQAIAQISFGLARLGPGGLIVGDVIGRVIGSEQMLRPLMASIRSSRPSRAGMLRQARTHWPFARVMVVASLFNALSLQIPFLLIPGLFGLDSSGQYFLAYRMLVLPASLVGAGVSQVFFGEASLRRDDPDRLRAISLNVAVTLMVFAIPTYGIVLVAGPDLIRILFGPQWGEAGLYAQLMAVGLIPWAVASPISTLLLVGRRERESLAFTIVELALKAASLVVGALLGSLVLGIALLSVTTFAISVGALWRILRVAGARVRELGRPALRVLAVTVPAAAVVLIATRLPAIVVVIVAAAAWAAALGVAARHSPEVRALVAGSHD